MNKYIIVYNLHHNYHDYTELYRAIKENYPIYFHLTEGSWVVFTEESANDIRKKIHDKFVYESPSDSYAVLKLDDGNDYSGYTVHSFWGFLKNDKEKETD